MNEKRPNKFNMNTVGFLFQNLKGWLPKKTQEQFMSAGGIISTKRSSGIEVRADSLNDNYGSPLESYFPLAWDGLRDYGLQKGFTYAQMYFVSDRPVYNSSNLCK